MKKQLEKKLKNLYQPYEEELKMFKMIQDANMTRLLQIQEIKKNIFQLTSVSEEKDSLLSEKDFNKLLESMSGDLGIPPDYPLPLPVYTEEEEEELKYEEVEEKPPSYFGSELERLED